MIENRILMFQQELGSIKHDLLNSIAQPRLEDEESYRIATKIDLAVSRLLRMLEYK